VSAPSKRRHVLYYLSLPVVAGLVVFLASRLVAMQRAEIIAELTAQIAHSEPSEASAAVRQLGEMPSPPAAVLVAAATGGDSKVAREAQNTIDRLLRRWQRQIDQGRGLRGVSKGLADLVDALAARQQVSTIADRDWIVGTAQRILTLSNGIPPKFTPMVATKCDSILESLPPSADTQVAKSQTEKVGSPPRDFEASENDSLHASTAEEHDADIPEENPVEDYHRADWSRPVFRMIPVERNNDSANDPRPLAAPAVTPKGDNTQPPTVRSLQPFAKRDVRALLKRWLSLDGSELVACEDELKKYHGFSHLTKSDVERLFSEQARDRVQLVDDVVTTQGVNSRPWLLLLADDSSADVRLAAVTVMATSSDPELVEKAWQTAIRDRDPRIAGLAARLRERRSAVQRR
jgi:hypothetical protein